MKPIDEMKTRQIKGEINYWNNALPWNLDTVRLAALQIELKRRRVAYLETVAKDAPVTVIRQFLNGKAGATVESARVYYSMLPVHVRDAFRNVYGDHPKFARVIAQ